MVREAIVVVVVVLPSVVIPDNAAVLADRKKNNYKQFICLTKFNTDIKVYRRVNKNS